MESKSCQFEKSFILWLLIRAINPIETVLVLGSLFGSVNVKNCSKNIPFVQSNQTQLRYSKYVSLDYFLLVDTPAFDKAIATDWA